MESILSVMIRLRHLIKKEQFETLNPFRLRKVMENKLKTIFNICYRKKPFVTIPLDKLLPGNIY
jgi:hypothetical protein